MNFSLVAGAFCSGYLSPTTQAEHEVIGVPVEQWVRESEFMLMAITIGLVQGGVQSLSRSLFGRLVPAGKAGEFFGFYNLMGKAAAILGPTLTGVVALLTHDSRLAILSIVVLFIIGAAFLSRVPVSAGQSRVQSP